MANAQSTCGVFPYRMINSRSACSYLSLNACEHREERSLQTITHQKQSRALLGTSSPFLRILLKGLRKLFSFSVCGFCLQKAIDVNTSS